jgi:hypothetical protein
LRDAEQVGGAFWPSERLYGPSHARDHRRCPGDRGHASSFVRGDRARGAQVARRPLGLCRVLRGRHDHGFALPKEERDALVASEPEKFLMPRRSDMRYWWVCARLDAIDVDELRELLVDAWRMCVPKKVATSYDRDRCSSSEGRTQQFGSCGELFEEGKDHADRTGAAPQGSEERGQGRARRHSPGTRTVTVRIRRSGRPSPFSTQDV